MIRFLLSAVLTLVLFSSCTMILSTNFPGSAEKTLPKEWLGKYEVVLTSPFPDKKDSTKPEKEFATIGATRITWQSNDGNKIYSLDDSLRYSVYDKTSYISLLMPQGLYAVFKVVKNGAALELYAMSSDEEPKKADLNKYFDKIEKKSDQGDEYYKVTIIEKKLDAFFKSSIPSKEPTRLVPVN
jgi:hypothetical protein